MANSVLIRKIYIDCPLCGKAYEVEERTRTASIAIKGEEIFYEERYDSTGYHFYPNTALDKSRLSKDEIDILDTVIAKFGNYNAHDIVNYMHRETAYVKTHPGEIIPYSLAKEIRAF